MLFNSQIFVFLFLPIVLVVYYLLRKAGANTLSKVALILASFVFYGYNHVSYLWILLGSILFNYVTYLVLNKTQKKTCRLLVATVAIVANIAVIFYFKYFDFFIENANRVLGTNWNLRHILLPLGISFFTFQQVSFVVDSYRRDVMEYSFVDYCLFVCFFPQLVAGPIVLHNQLIPQFTDEKRYHFNLDGFSDGCRYFVIGLFKKTMVADRFGRVVDLGYAGVNSWSTPSAAFIILAYTLQIYFDFSGYSDMAIGLGKMLNFDIPVNFDMPYKATDISEFWKRWHMTMTGFFTKYVYFPLGGSKKGVVRTYINVMIVFAISGLWHGAAWSFVEWGIMHGVAQCIQRAFSKYIKELPRLLTGTVTFIFVNIAWVLFRAGGLYQSNQMLRYLVFGGFGESFELLCAEFAGGNLGLLLKNIPVSASFYDIYNLVITLVGILATLLVVFLAPSSHQIVAKKPKDWHGIIYALMAVMAIMTFMDVSTFLYFNF